MESKACLREYDMEWMVGDGCKYMERVVGDGCTAVTVHGAGGK